MSYNNQNALRIDEVMDEKGLKGSLKKPAPDPLLNMEYVSPVNQGRFSSIGKLESGVSLLQAAQIGIDKTMQWLQEIRQFLESSREATDVHHVPISVANRYIQDRLALIDQLVKSSRFQGKAVLDGSYGIQAYSTGKRLKFVRGSARVTSSPDKGFPVKIVQPPKPSILLGYGTLTEQELKEEKLIALNDGSQEVRYRVRKNETPETLINNLKKCLMNHNFDVDVYKTDDQRLYFRHNQLGSKNSFKGLSLNSRLISEIPGQYASSNPGIDIAGTINDESAHGDGGFLIGDAGNKRTDGLVVFFDGQIDFPGQVVGYIHSIQKGMAVPLDATGSLLEMLSLPSIDPTMLAVGVANSRGFENLAAIRIADSSDISDALRLIIWSSVYLKYLSKELKQKEDEYIERTIELLHGSMDRFNQKEDPFSLSREKADDMISQIKEMLNH